MNDEVITLPSETVQCLANYLYENDYLFLREGGVDRDLLAKTIQSFYDSLV